MKHIPSLILNIDNYGLYGIRDSSHITSVWVRFSLRQTHLTSQDAENNILTPQTSGLLCQKWSICQKVCKNIHLQFQGQILRTWIVSGSSPP